MFPYTSTPAYPRESGSFFYAPNSHTFPHVDARSCLGPSSSAPGMEHALRFTTLSHPITRDLYTPATASFRRAPENTPNSPSFPDGHRRRPMPSAPHLKFDSIRHPGDNVGQPMMNASHDSKHQQAGPPLVALTMLGLLHYSDAPNTHIEPAISATINKGFFLEEQQWICYRRNYFSCTCSFDIQQPANPQATLHFTPSGSAQPQQVASWAMCISAVVSENESHVIELLQYTSKRDKGPVSNPEKTTLLPKSPQTAYDPIGHYAQTGTGPRGSSRVYEQPPYGQPLPHTSSHTPLPTEHTFERIQFKQATANNGNHRGAQKHYYLMIELFAGIGAQGQEDWQWLKVAHRKSANVIVRGRSPGHYGSKQGAISSGSGRLGCQIGRYTGLGSNMFRGAYRTGYDMQPQHDRIDHGEFHDEPISTSEQWKAAHQPGRNQYYHKAIIDSAHDLRQPVELFHNNSFSFSSDDPLRMGNGFLWLTQRGHAQYMEGSLVDGKSCTITTQSKEKSESHET